MCVCVRLYEEEGRSVRVSVRFALQKEKKGKKRLDIFLPDFFFSNERRDVHFILRNDIHGFIL